MVSGRIMSAISIIDDIDLSSAFSEIKKETSSALYRKLIREFASGNKLKEKGA